MKPGKGFAYKFVNRGIHQSENTIARVVGRLSPYLEVERCVMNALQRIQAEQLPAAQPTRHGRMRLEAD